MNRLIYLITHELAGEQSIDWPASSRLPASPRCMMHSLAVCCQDPHQMTTSMINMAMMSLFRVMYLEFYMERYFMILVPRGQDDPD